MASLKVILIFLLSLSLSYSKHDIECSGDQRCNPMNWENPLEMGKLVSHNYICYDGLCKCEPNYHYNRTEEKCQEFKCNYDIQCQDYDPNRRCAENGKCVCKEGTAEVSMNGRKCTENPFLTNDCLRASDCRHKNFRCIKNKCVCLPGYNINEQYECERHGCTINQDCYDENDPHRICNNDSNPYRPLPGRCICRPGYVENNPEQRLCIRSDNNNGSSVKPKNRLKVSFDGYIQIA